MLIRGEALALGSITRLIRKPPLVGLDIGSRTVKACEIVPSMKGTFLKHLAIADIAPGLIEDGIVTDPGGLALEVRELFDTHGIRQHNVVIALGGHVVMVKNIVLQCAPGEKLYHTLVRQAEKYIPYDMAKVDLAFHVLGADSNDPHRIHVLLAAAKKEFVTGYIDMLAQAGLRPALIDLDVLALQNIHEFSCKGDDKRAAVIDIGSAKTTINIIQNQTPLFIRNFSSGCDQINREIMTNRQCTWKEAERLKLREGLKLKIDRAPSGGHTDLGAIISSVAARWCAEIQRAMDFFTASQDGGRIHRLVLSGGGAGMEAFRRLLTIRTGLRVDVLDPFNNLMISPGRFDPTYIKRVAPQAAITIGLALRGAKGK